MSGIRCRFCRGERGEVVLDLGDQPASEYFPPSSDQGRDDTFPLRMWLCAACGLAQLADDCDVPEEVLGAEPAALRLQRREAVGRLVAEGLLPDRGTVTEFPSPHGGTFLDLLAERGLTPAAPGAPADVAVDGCFGLMHHPDQRAAFHERAGRLRPGGTLVLQFHSLGAIVRYGQWNAVRHGHYAYYSLPAMRTMLAEVGLRAEAAMSFPLYGGTILVTARAGTGAEAGGEAGTAGTVAELVCAEDRAGVRDVATVSTLQRTVHRSAEILAERVRRERDAGRRVYGYGAASRAVSLLFLAGLDARDMIAVADASPAKQGRRMPGCGIPIIAPEELVAASPDLVLVFVPDLMAEVRSALPEIEARGGRWEHADTT